MKIEKFTKYLEAGNTELYTTSNKLNIEVAQQLEDFSAEDLVFHIRNDLNSIKTEAGEEKINKIANFEKYLDMVDELDQKNEDVVLKHEILKVYRNILKFSS